MKRSLMGSLLLCVVWGGCASMSPEEQRTLAESRSRITVVQAMSASDALLFQEVGRVSCDIGWHNLGQDIEESCRNQLKDQAAKLNASIVVVESREKKKCTYGLQDDACLGMSGHAYIKRPAEKPPVTTTKEGNP